MTSGLTMASDDDGTLRPAPLKTVRLWCETVKVVRPDELESFERRVFAIWDRASFGDHRRRELGQ
jgi:hypothetical protein